MNHFDTPNTRPPHERPVALDYARQHWPEAFGIALEGLGIEPVKASTCIFDSRLVLALWGPPFDYDGEDCEGCAVAAITGPLSTYEEAELIESRKAAH